MCVGCLSRLHVAYIYINICTVMLVVTTECVCLIAALSLQLNIVDFIPSLLYFGYTVVMVIGFWLLTGTIGFYATYFFICRIYAAVKQD